uniref:RNA helicase n=1 Tax=Panagrolaimus sp. PS1159 TaxID=55785 RepID=A0AC35GW19_9BILA
MDQSQPQKRRRNRRRKAKTVNGEPQAPNAAETPADQQQKKKRRPRRRNRAKKETGNSQQNFSSNIPTGEGPNNSNGDFKSLYDGDANITVNGKKSKRHCENWNEMDFDQQLLKNIKDCGLVKPRKVQEVVLPYLVEGYDIDCQSETGTGKTAAYLIPLIDNLIKEKHRSNGLDPDGPYCLIIAPTREFVQQIFIEAVKLTKNTGITVASAYGGIRFIKTSNKIAKGCNILCATVGRLLHLIDHDNPLYQNLDMSNLKYVVVDEADHFLEGNRKQDILRFFNHQFLPQDIKRQICFFSATLQVSRLHRISDEFVNTQKRVFITSVLDSNQRIQYIFDSIPSEDAKYPCLTTRLSDLLKVNGGKYPKIMVFVNRKKFANELTDKLIADGFPAVVMHSDFSQARREKAFYSFKNGIAESRIFVSVNACGRGIDIPEMDYVINYNLPLDKYTFIQKCGRTGRTKNGTAITFYVESDDRARASWIREVLQRAQHDVPNFLKPNTVAIEESMGGLSLK